MKVSERGSKSDMDTVEMDHNGDISKVPYKTGNYD